MSDNVFGLNLMPLPQADFGPEEAKRFIETELRGYESIARAGFGKNRQHDGTAFAFILEDIVTMAVACVEVVASGEPVEFARHDYAGYFGERERAQFLAEILASPDLFEDDNGSRDVLLPMLGKEVVDFLRAEGQEVRRAERAVAD